MGCLAPLGKFLVMTLKGGVIKEKPERLVQIIARTTAFLQGAMQHASGLVKYEEFEAIIGVWLYIAQTCLALVPLLQYPLYFLLNMSKKYTLQYYTLLKAEQDAKDTRSSYRTTHRGRNVHSCK